MSPRISVIVGYLIERHRKDIRGVLSCFDRVAIQGTIPSICHPKAMAAMLDSRGIRLFEGSSSSPSNCRII
jgi:hypothetical protein